MTDRDQRERELHEEIESHFRMAVEDRVARGEERRAAERAVRREFGNRGQVEETTRSMWRGAGLDAFRRQVGAAARSLRLSPGFTLASVLTLGLGIGGVAAMAALVSAILVKPLPYPNPDRLFAVRMYLSKMAGATPALSSDAIFFTLERLSRSAAAIGASRVDEVNVSDEATPERLSAGRVTAGYFGVLGAAPVAGRPFSAEEDVANGPAVVVLSERLWRRRFGARLDIIGKPLRIDGKAHEIVGVMPATVALPEPDVELWVPLALDAANTLAVASNYEIVTRLRPGVTVEGATRDFQQAIDRLSELYPDAGFGLSTAYWMSVTGAQPQLQPLRDRVVGDVGKTLWILLGTAAFVLLVAGANVATLFLVRGEARRRELAVRLALGSSRRSLTARFLTEGSLLAGMAALLGTALAAVAISIVAQKGAASLPRLDAVRIDGATIALVVALTALIGLCCGLLPMTRIETDGIATILRSGGRAATSGRDRQRARRGLVIAQVAFAFALLAGSGLLARTFWQLRSVEPGFDARDAMALRVGLPASTYPDAPDVARVFQTMEDRIRALPGVRAVGFATKLPLRGGGESDGTVMVEDRPDADLAKSGAHSVMVAGDYFRAIGIPIVAGRTFERLDPDRVLNEVVISRQLAYREWGDSTGRASLGRRVRLTPTAPWLTVVGVVGDVRTESLDLPAQPTTYLPLTSSWSNQSSWTSAAEQRLAAIALPRAMSVVVDRAGAGPRAGDEIRAAIRAVDPTTAVYDAMPMSRVLTASMARLTFTGWLLAIAAGSALLLGVIGVYGIVAYTVSLRSREIGLRLALGAKAAEVAAMLVKQGMVLVLLGVGGGLILTLAVSGVLRGLLYGVSPSDPVTLGAVAAVLIAAAVGASWVPARRAGKIDPASVLGAD